MAQNKGLNIALLAAVFAVSIVSGYFLAQVLIKPQNDEYVSASEYEPQYASEILEEEPEEDYNDSTAYYDSLYQALKAAEAAAETGTAATPAEDMEKEEEVAAPEPYRYYSKEMMQHFLDDKDWERRPTDSKVLFPQSMRLEFIDLDPEKDEYGVSTLAEVCNKLMMGFWERAIVVDMTHNSMNQITKVVLRVQYPGGESYYEEY